VLHVPPGQDDPGTSTEIAFSISDRAHQSHARHNRPGSSVARHGFGSCERFALDGAGDGCA
jgi:hypothetical protein